MSTRSDGYAHASTWRGVYHGECVRGCRSGAAGCRVLRGACVSPRYTRAPCNVMVRTSACVSTCARVSVRVTHVMEATYGIQLTTETETETGTRDVPCVRDVSLNRAANREDLQEPMRPTGMIA